MTPSDASDRAQVHASAAVTAAVIPHADPLVWVLQRIVTGERINTGESRVTVYKPLPVRYRREISLLGRIGGHVVVFDMAERARGYAHIHRTDALHRTQHAAQGGKAPFIRDVYDVVPVRLSRVVGLIERAGPQKVGGKVAYWFARGPEWTMRTAGETTGKGAGE